MKTIKVHKDNMREIMRKLDEKDIVSQREEGDFIFLTVDYA